MTAKCREEEQQARDALKAEAELVARVARLSGKQGEQRDSDSASKDGALSDFDLAALMSSDEEENASVQKLLKRLEEEAALDKNLEEAGLSHVINKPKEHAVKGSSPRTSTDKRTSPGLAREGMRKLMFVC